MKTSEEEFYNFINVILKSTWTSGRFRLVKNQLKTFGISRPKYAVCLRIGVNFGIFDRLSSHWYKWNIFDRDDMYTKNSTAEAGAKMLWKIKVSDLEKHKGKK